MSYNTILYYTILYFTILYTILYYTILWLEHSGYELAIEAAEIRLAASDANGFHRGAADYAPESPLDNSSSKTLDK